MRVLKATCLKPMVRAQASAASIRALPIPMFRNLASMINDCTTASQGFSKAGLS
jgi:hypothetical protein